MSSARNHLWLALRFRELPLHVLNADIPPEHPVAVTERRAVIFCNAAARALGVTRGMDSATARFAGDCVLVPRKPSLESAILYQLRDQLYRFTPHIALHESKEAPQSGLLLEISTCLRLFSGVRNLCDAILKFLADAGHEVRWGLAHTAPGAWLLSFAHHEPSGDETRQMFIDRLNTLPVQVLYDHPGAVDTLVKTGFTTLGDVARQITANGLTSFARRLGPQFANTLAEIYAIERDFSQRSLFSASVSTHVPVIHFEDSLSFDTPLALIEHLQPAFEHLLQNLGAFLDKRQLTCQHIQWQLSDIYQHKEIVDIRSDIPQSGWQLLYDLTLITFANRPIPFEVDALTLLCHDRQPRQDSSATLDLNGEHRQPGVSRELAATLMKLKTRLGDTALHKVSYRDSLLPELSHAMIGIGEKCVQQLPRPHHKALRPTWLLSEPEEITERNGRLYWQGRLTLAAGPERLTSHWWETPVARDYYLARRQDKQTLWIFQDLHDERWYVQGFFG